MWPFSTIRDLRLELALAETGAETLRGIINRQDGDNGRLKTQLREAVNEQIKRRNWSDELAASLEVRRQLAAERDEAVLRARNVDQRYAACQNKLAEANLRLKGAMIRDPRTGRLTKWVEPEDDFLKDIVQ